jgi:hypothetical protein
MTPESGFLQTQSTGQTQKATVSQTRAAIRGSYGELGIAEPEDGRDEDSALDESPEYEDSEEQEDDFAPDISEGAEEEAGDLSFVPYPSLLPPKWLWIPQAEGSRLLWAASELTPRLDALEIFRMFAEAVLNAVYFAEKNLFKTSKARDYTPPSPLDLEKFFLKEWLEDFVKHRDSKSLGSFPIKHLSSFTIAVPIREECFFVKPDSLLYGIGSPRGAGTLRTALLERWAKLEMNINGWRKEDITGGGKFLRRTKDYVEALNASLAPLLGKEIFRFYEERSLYAPAKRLKEIL